MLLIHFMLCLNDPRGNGGLDTPNIEVGDPFDHLGEQDTLKKEISKSPKKINDGELVEDDNEFTNEVRQSICNTYSLYKQCFRYLLSFRV